MPIPVRTTLKPLGLLARVLTTYLPTLVLKHLTQSLVRQSFFSQHSQLCLTAWESNTPSSHPSLRGVDTSVLTYTHLPSSQLWGQNQRASAFAFQVPFESAAGSSGGHPITHSDSPSEFQHRFLKLPSPWRDVPNRSVTGGPFDWPYVSL